MRVKINELKGGVNLINQEQIQKKEKEGGETWNSWFTQQIQPHLTRQNAFFGLSVIVILLTVASLVFDRIRGKIKGKKR